MLANDFTSRAFVADAGRVSRGYEVRQVNYINDRSARTRIDAEEAIQFRVTTDFLPRFSNGRLRGGLIYSWKPAG